MKLLYCLLFINYLIGTHLLSVYFILYKQTNNTSINITIFNDCINYLVITNFVFLISIAVFIDQRHRTKNLMLCNFVIVAVSISAFFGGIVFAEVQLRFSYGIKTMGTSELIYYSIAELVFLVAGLFVAVQDMIMNWYFNIDTSNT